MPLPSREECIALLCKHKLPEHIIRHSLTVEKIAVFLAKKFNAKGIKVDTELVSRGAILHDIDKPQTLDSETVHMHGHLSKKILEAEGFPRLGEIALKHRLFRVLEKNSFSSWEEKLVYYADKRVKHDKIVSLQERFNYLLKTYGEEKTVFDKIAKCKPRVEQLEKEIFSNLDITPSLEGL